MGSVIRMKEGLGENSYAKNSSLQKKATDIIKHLIISSAIDTYISKTPKSMAIADLGCSSGPNAFSLAIDIVNGITQSCHKASRQEPEFQVFLNDLPTNDFNALFTDLPEFIGKLTKDGRNPPSVFVNGVPGSFHGRLFPSNSLHFIYSCASLHWLSKVPSGLFDNSGIGINRGKIYISATSPPAVATAYSNQFQEDLNNILRSRSVELVSDGRFVIFISGRRHHHHHQENSFNLLWDALARCLANMASKKVVEEELVDSFNLPIYIPSLKEIQDAVLKEGTFVIDYAELHETITRTGDAKKDAWNTSMTIRAGLEPMILCHFNLGDEVINEIFQEYSERLRESFERKEVGEWVNFVVTLRKLN